MSLGPAATRRLTAARIGLACVLAFIILVMLSGCAVMRPIKVPEVINETSIYQLGNAYGVAQSAAITYASLPLCREGSAPSATNWCRTKAVTASLADLDAKFVKAYEGLQAFIRAPSTKDGLTVIELYAVASAALNQMLVLARPIQ